MYNVTVASLCYEFVIEKLVCWSQQDVINPQYNQIPTFSDPYKQHLGTRKRVQLKLQSSFLVFAVLFYEYVNFKDFDIISDSTYSDGTDKAFESNQS